MSLFDRGAVRAPQVFRRDGERVQSPFEDVPGGVHVGVRRVRAFLADEDRLALAVLLVHMPASAACLARVGGVDFRRISKCEQRAVRRYNEITGSG